MKILVTGGFGFVGKSVCNLLEGKGLDYEAHSRRNGLDLRDYYETTQFIRRNNPEVIINCSAHVGSLHYVSEKAGDVIKDNTEIIVNLYNAVACYSPKTKIINPISNCSYPGDALTQKESEWLNGPVHDSVLSFASAKRLWVAVSQCYEKQYGIQSVNFLFPNAYGIGDYTDPNKTHALNGMIMRMLKAKANGDKTFEIWGTGKPKREWIYVGDFARMLVNAIKQPSQIYPVNVAQNEAYSIKETAEMIRDIIGYEGKLTFNTKYQDGDPIKILDNTIFKSKYPYFKFTNIEDGIRLTSKYYEKELKL